MPLLQKLEGELAQLADPAIAVHSARFFKTGPGEYGEGDLFLGIRVPQLRKRVRTYRDFKQQDIVHLLASPYHEKRLFACLLLVDRFQRGDHKTRKDVYETYLDNLGKGINNWDLIDSTCPHIIGAWLFGRDRSVLYRLAVSTNLWQRRAAMMACFFFIRNNDFDDALSIMTRLLGDGEDLIHKACGWMLREIAKRDQTLAESFLEKHCRIIPRTMLRYAIERFDQVKRRYYLTEC